MEWLWDLLVNLHWGAVGQIIMIDILLGGDNAVVIALACRNLPHEQRLKGVFWGTFGGVAGYIRNLILLRSGVHYSNPASGANA